MGMTAVLDAGGIVLVVMERPVPPSTPSSSCRSASSPATPLIVVKGAVAWRSAYGDVAAEVIEVDTPICPLDPGAASRDGADARMTTNADERLAGAGLVLPEIPATPFTRVCD